MSWSPDDVGCSGMGQSVASPGSILDKLSVYKVCMSIDSKPALLSKGIPATSSTQQPCPSRRTLSRPETWLRSLIDLLSGMIDYLELLEYDSRPIPITSALCCMLQLIL